MTLRTKDLEIMFGEKSTNNVGTMRYPDGNTIDVSPFDVFGQKQLSPPDLFDNKEYINIDEELMNKADNKIEYINLFLAKHGYINMDIANRYK